MDPTTQIFIRVPLSLNFFGFPLTKKPPEFLSPTSVPSLSSYQRGPRRASRKEEPAGET